MVSPAVRANLVFYNTRPAFDLANPGLPTETFEAANIAPGASFFFTGPLNSATSNAVISPGSILPGVSIVDSPGPDAGDMVYLGDGTEPGFSKGILDRPINDTLDLTFAPGVHSVGFDFGATLRPGVINFGSFTMSIYGSGGFLASQFISSPESIAFFGVFSSTDLITRVNVEDGALHSELIDNLSFGTSVPEPASTSLLLVSLAVAALKSRRS